MCIVGVVEACVVFVNSPAIKQIMLPAVLLHSELQPFFSPFLMILYALSSHTHKHPHTLVAGRGPRAMMAPSGRSRGKEESSGQEEA